VIYSHTHADHWGGIRGIVDEADVRSGKITVIAPVDFMQFTISESVFARNAMNRRLFYQYGLLLFASPHGYVGQGLGQGVSAGAMGLIAPNRYIKEAIEEIDVDGVRMIFQNTPNTDAPREMNTYIPGMKALWMAENVTSTLHNTRRSGPRPAELVEIHQRGALQVRPQRRSHVCLAPLAALGQRAYPGGAARSARYLCSHEQSCASSRQPGRDHQREEPAADTTARPNTTPAAWSNTIWASGTATRRR
jgi:hypothetical protein